jgi:hypothetical protein
MYSLLSSISKINESEAFDALSRSTRSLIEQFDVDATEHAPDATAS